MDYFDGGDHVRRGFLSTADASSCLCSSSMASNLQHACFRAVGMSSPDAVFRSLLAVVLIFFVLMDPSLLVFGALHRPHEPILSWWRSQPTPTLVNLRFQLLHDEVSSLPAKNVRHSAIFTAQVSVLISEMKIWIEDQNSHSVICCMAARKSRSFYIRFMLLMLYSKGAIVVCRRYMADFLTRLKTIEYASRSYPSTPTNSIIERRHSAESILDYLLRFSILEGIAS